MPEEETKEEKPKINVLALQEIQKQTNNNAVFYKKLLENFEVFNETINDKLESNLWIMRLIVVALFLLVVTQCVKIT